MAQRNYGKIDLNRREPIHIEHGNRNLREWFFAVWLFQHYLIKESDWIKLDCFEKAKLWDEYHIYERKVLREKR